ncbi:hypothetical protein [Bradyrhizobium sp. SZCCHNRI2049]|uniref:hypothetical protein n=1 Tax=Bradyrhizobium sp. SZCCHNRI2049 TaxID=3057287 RepID=UPI002916B5B5|nr:hypothetical protein [Bradyrhizobium sp. SZCCHNRI2049]
MPRVVTTIVSAASTTDLTSLSVIKDELSIATGDTSKDATLTRYLKSASAAVLQYVNRRAFLKETIKDEIWPDHDPHPYVLSGAFEVLTLSTWPAISVASVTEDDTTLTKDVDYLVDAARGRLFRLDGAGNTMLWSARPKVVQYDAGYDTIPSDVEDAVLRMITSRWAAKGRDKTLRSEDIPGVVSRQWWIATGGEAGNMPPDITDLLDNYRVPVLV